MKKQLISEISRQMAPYLDNAQMEQLQEVLKYCLWNVSVSEMPNSQQQQKKESNSEKPPHKTSLDNNNLASIHRQK